MVDEIFDRTYQQGRAGLNSGIERTLDSIGTQWRKLNRIQWRAPWNAWGGIDG